MGCAFLTAIRKNLQFYRDGLIAVISDIDFFYIQNLHQKKCNMFLYGGNIYAVYYVLINTQAEQGIAVMC